MRTLLTVAALLVLVSEPAWAESYFQFGSPSARQYYLPPTYQYFTPPPRANRRAQPKAAIVQIPQPEKAAIAEEYAKGSIVIVNHERNLYFVEETGQAIRYPVAIGKPVDQWEGLQTITAKRENPTWYPPEEIQWESDVPPVVPPGPQNPLGPRALYLGDTLYTEFTGQTGPAQSAARFRMAAFACTTLTSSNCTKKYKSEPTFTWCLD
jgi:lipoprotein-anchoring transpeptidase ErfK/SrfK